MAAAQRIAEEVLGTCRQKALLALRRSVLPTTPIRSERKSELIADIAAECDTPGSRQRIFARVFVNWSMHELRLIKARLRGLGYMVPVGKRPRKQDLIAAIVSAGELAATAPTVSERTRKGIFSSASAAARAPTVSKPAASSSAGVAEQPGLRAEGASQGSSFEGPGSAVEPPSCTALVALDSAAAPLKLRQKLSGRWRKKWAKLFKKYRATTTVGELRAMVGQAMGLPLDGKYRLRFDRALAKLTCAPTTKRRAQRFIIARRSS